MSALTEGAAGLMGRAAGIRGEQYRAGFLAGLEFFERNPVFRGQ